MTGTAPLMLVFAHPDDESFTCGGTIARYASSGVPVHLVCATRGEVGEISDPSLATPQNLGDVREEELRRAARTLGAAEPIFLGFRDSGMAGTAENNDPRSLHQTPAELVVERLVHLIRRIRPGAVITFDETGGYGHPDHVAIHRHATAAFFAASRKDSFPHHFSDGLQPWATSRLFYTCFPQGHWQRLWEAAQARGIEAPRFLERRERFGVPDDQVSTLLDVADFVHLKREAVAAHRTQLQPDNPFTRLPHDLMAEFQSTEFFLRAFPYDRSPVPERDLYAGVEGETNALRPVAEGGRSV